jgi:hypothetical protein
MNLQAEVIASQFISFVAFLKQFMKKDLNLPRTGCDRSLIINPYSLLRWQTKSMNTYHRRLVTESVSRARLALLIKRKVAGLVVAVVVCNYSAISIVLSGLLLKRLAIRNLSNKHAVDEKCSEKGSNKICESLKKSTFAAIDKATSSVASRAVVWPVFVVTVFPVRGL